MPLLPSQKILFLQFTPTTLTVRGVIEVQLQPPFFAYKLCFTWKHLETQRDRTEAIESFPILNSLTLLKEKVWR